MKKLVFLWLISIPTYGETCKPLLQLEGATLQTGAMNAKLSKCREGSDFVELEVERILFPSTRVKLPKRLFETYFSNLEQAHSQLSAIAKKAMTDCHHPVEITFHHKGKPRVFQGCPTSRALMIAQFLDGMLLVLVSS